jgi:hypothetical protein
MLSYLLYSLPLITLAIASQCKKELKLYGIIFASFSIICILVLRDNVGFDYHAYLSIYYENRPTSEPLYKLVHMLTLDFQDHYVYFSVFALIATLPVIYVALKRQSIWVLFIYITLPQFYIESFGIIRQGCALGLCIYGYHLYDSKSKGWIFPIIVAIGFHYSAIVFLLTLLSLNYSGVFLKKVIVFVLISIIFVHREVLEILIVYYPKLDFYDGSNTYGLKQVIFNVLLFVISYRFLNSRDAKLIIFMGLIITIPLMGIDAVLLRLVSYFLIPFLFLSGQTYRRTDFSFASVIILMLIMGFFSILYLKSLNSIGPMVPYESIFGP